MMMQSARIMFPSEVVGCHRSGSDDSGSDSERFRFSFRLERLSSDLGEVAILSLFRIPAESVAPDFSRTRSGISSRTPCRLFRRWDQRQLVEQSKWGRMISSYESPILASDWNNRHRCEEKLLQFPTFLVNQIDTLRCFSQRDTRY